LVTVNFRTAKGRFDQLVGAREERRWYVEAERFAEAVSLLATRVIAPN
jgi:hypothetical protein